MVHASCAVKDCGSSSYIHKNLKFHQFPRFEERCKIWVEACGRTDLVDKTVSSLKNKYICSLHFEKHMYGRKSLKKTATPTLRLPSDRVNSIYAQIDKTIDTVLYEKHVGFSQNRKFLENHEQTDPSASDDEIIINKEITDADKTQCHLCLSIGRKMQKLGELTPLYRKLLFENDFQDPLVVNFMYQMPCCWECRAELLRVQRFQDKVRQAHNAFETSQNQKSESLSNLSTILIGEYRSLNPESNSRPIGVEDRPLVVVVKKEPVEIAVVVEQEETILPDPLDGYQDLESPMQESRIKLEMQDEPNMQILTKQTVIHLESTQKVPKRVQNRPKSSQNKAKKAKVNQIDSIVSQDTEIDPIASKYTEMDSMESQETEIDLIALQETEIDPIAFKESEIDPIASQETEIVKKESKGDPIISQESETDPQASQESENPKESRMSGMNTKVSQDSDTDPKSTTETNPDVIFVKVKIEMKELKKILQERRNTESFKNMQYKCESCVLGFTDQNRAEEHNRMFHDEEVGALSCDICLRRFATDSQLSQHYRSHFAKFVCKLCHAQCYTKTGRAVHYKKHNTRT